MKKDVVGDRWIGFLQRRSGFGAAALAPACFPSKVMCPRMSRGARATEPPAAAALPATAGLLAVTFAVALGVQPARAAEGPPATDKDALKKITDLIGDAACDNDSQCRTIPIGAKACGGPEYYLAWSTKRTDAAELRKAAEGNVAFRRNIMANRGGSSNCVVVTDPGAYCAPAGGQGAEAASRHGRSCRLRATGAGGRGPVD